ncbi:DHH family phosphoesterase [Bacillus massiliglaciei]|uniref:DHH family phosphoesterase n=1 Tax=Bacillus massiliglaciei TaxID=1816693 RepID=UPI000B214D11|nr:DHH family phosphoesterase [Bacillus massiliglaciei]
MLKSKSRWNVQRSDEETVAMLADNLHITTLAATLLANRGLTSLEQARSFLFVKKQDFYDPFLLKDMDVAVSRINKAIEQNEKIRIFGDYDAGATRF